MKMQQRNFSEVCQGLVNSYVKLRVEQILGLEVTPQEPHGAGNEPSVMRVLIYTPFFNIAKK